jgi:YD repeat-containing protein
VQYSDGTPTETFSYDSLGRVVSISDGSGLYQLAYNRDSSLQSVDGPWAGDTVSYFYDAKGRLVRSRYEGGQDVFYTYDDLDRLSRILHGSKSFEYSYSAQNLLEKVSLANEQ